MPVLHQDRAGEEVYAASATTTTDELVASQAGRLKGVLVRATGTAGTAVFDDGGSTILTINTQAAVGNVMVPIPSGGVTFATDLGVTLTNVDGVVAFYGKD